MTSSIVTLVGGYGSDGFWMLAFGLLLVGSILNAVHSLIFKVIGMGLFIFGGVMLMGMVEDTVNSNPNLPDYASYIPLLFAIILILVVFKMMLFNYPAKKDATTPDQSINNEEK
jgi:hypothetical protein